MWTAKTLTRLRGCPGWSESSLGAHAFCWFCHVAAHFCSLCDIRNYQIHTQLPSRTVIKCVSLYHVFVDVHQEIHTVCLTQLFRCLLTDWKTPSFIICRADVNDFERHALSQGTAFVVYMYALQLAPLVTGIIVFFKTRYVEKKNAACLMKYRKITTIYTPANHSHAKPLSIPNLVNYFL